MIMANSMITAIGDLMFFKNNNIDYIMDHELYYFLNKNDNLTLQAQQCRN
jgi:hypothetical protein